MHIRAMEMNSCPSCGGYLRTRKKVCSCCALEIGSENFSENPIVYLPRKDQDFILEFLICRGNYKALCDRLSVTYPTARARLDRIVARMESLPGFTSSSDILDAIEGGKMDAKQGIEKLKKLRKG